MELKGGERIVSRKETKVLIRKAKKALDSYSDNDYKSLGKYICTGSPEYSWRG